VIAAMALIPVLVMRGDPAQSQVASPSRSADIAQRKVLPSSRMAAPKPSVMKIDDLGPNDRAQLAASLDELVGSEPATLGRHFASRPHVSLRGQRVPQGVGARSSNAMMGSGLLWRRSRLLHFERKRKRSLVPKALGWRISWDSTCWSISPVIRQTTVSCNGYVTIKHASGKTFESGANSVGLKVTKLNV
jgi:hypothetical protein